MKIAKLGVALSLTAAGVFACGDDGGSGGTDPDSSVGEVDSGPRADASPNIDADLRPTSGACSIVVAPPFSWDFETFGAPDLSGNTVVFSGPDGAEIELTATNAAGVATSASCVRDTMITAFFIAPTPPAGGGGPPPGFPFVATFAGVQPEDTAYWGSNTFAADPDPTYSFVNTTFDQDVTAFGDPDILEPDDVDYVRLTIAHGGGPPTLGTCNPSQTSAAFDSYAYLSIPLCAVQADGTIDLHAIAYKDDSPVGHAFLHDVAVVPGTDISPAETVAALPAWTPGLALNSMTVTNAPTSAIIVKGELLQRVDRVGHARRGGFLDDQYWTGTSNPPVVLSETYEGLSGEFANGTEAHGMAVYENSEEYRWTEMSVSGPFTDSAEVEMATALPRISGLLLTLPEPNRPALHWLSDAPMTGAKGAFMGFAIIDPDDGPIAFWVVATHTAKDGTVQLPAIPAASIETLLPAGFQIVPIFVSVWGADYQSYTDLITTEGFGPERFITPPGMPCCGTTPWPLREQALPALPPIDVVGTARRSGFTSSFVAD